MLIKKHSIKNICDISTGEELHDFMVEPTDELVESMKRLDGDIIVLGASGKVGPELIETLVRADKRTGVSGRKIMGVDLFSLPRNQDIKKRFIESLGIQCFDGDVTDESYLATLPTVPNVIFMIGFKFGSSDDPGKAILINCLLPGNVAMKYSRSRIINFSSGNPYPHTKPQNGGARETDRLNPQGIYGYAIMGREMAFTVSAHGLQNQKVCHFRLMYAQHLMYGVLVDLAKMILDGEKISLEMPYVNLVSQRDTIDRALRAFDICSNPATILNVAGPIVSVEQISRELGNYIGKTPLFAGKAPESALIANDDFCISRFGPYRDSVNDMIRAAAHWVIKGGGSWGLPTMFGKASHKY